MDRLSVVSLLATRKSRLVMRVCSGQMKMSVWSWVSVRCVVRMRKMSDPLCFAVTMYRVS